MNEKMSEPYAGLCAEYYELDKPLAPEKELSYYMQHAQEAEGPILEPMCGTGRFLIPMVQKGYSIVGFDSSSHMLDVCRKKCPGAVVKRATFDDFKPETLFKLIFIPSGSFSLLTEPQAALQNISKWLAPNGKFVFDVETISESQEVWKGNWIDKPDGSKLVLNTFSKFDPKTSINTTLCRYELWENNQITKTEVEDFRLRLYKLDELDKTLQNHGFKILNKKGALYECIKG